MTIDKAALLARAKADPAAFREEAARLLDGLRMHRSAANIRSGFSTDCYAYALEILRGDEWEPACLARAHVEALAEALGVAL